LSRRRSRRPEGRLRRRRFHGTRDGAPFEAARRSDAPDPGDDRLIRVSRQPRGAAKGEKREFDVVFPRTTRKSRCAARRPTSPSPSTSCAPRSSPMPRTSSLGPSASSRTWPTSRPSCANARNERPRPGPPRLRRQDHRIRRRQRHRRTADILIDQEVEVMRDELRSALARQGSARRRTSRSQQDRGGSPQGVPAAGREARQDAARSLGDRQGRSVEVPDGDVQAEIAGRGRATRMTRVWSDTSNRNVAETTSGAPFGGREPWSSSSTSGSRLTPRRRVCLTWKTPRKAPLSRPVGRGCRVGWGHGPGEPNAAGRYRSGA